MTAGHPGDHPGRCTRTRAVADTVRVRSLLCCYVQTRSEHTSTYLCDTRNYAELVWTNHQDGVKYLCTLLLCCTRNSQHILTILRIYSYGAISFNKRRWFGDRYMDGVPKLTPVHAPPQRCSDARFCSVYRHVIAEAARRRASLRHESAIGTTCSD